MNKGADWMIAPSTPDWECDWKGSRRFHLRYFRSLSLEEKLRAVESMAQVAEFLLGRARPTSPSGKSVGDR